METLKKASEEVLWTANLNSDTDLNIPELLLLEQHVDRRDQACSANLPSPREAPATQDVGVVTDACHGVSTSSNVACQTESSPASATVAISSSGLSGERRSAPNALWVGGLGTLSLNAKGTVSVRASGKSGGPHSPVTNTPETAAHLKSSSVVAATTNTTTIASATAPVTNPHHKKQLASEACRSRSGAVSDLASSRPVEGRGSAINAVQGDSSASRSVIKSRKKQTSCTSLDKDMTYPSPLPGQTVRTIHHSYGTRAAARTPAKDLVTPFPQPLCKENGKSSASSLPKPKMETSGAGSAAILMSDEDLGQQTQMIKHRGRTLKGRIVDVLSSEGFKTVSSSSPNLTPTASSSIPNTRERQDVQNPSALPNLFLPATSSADLSTLAVPSTVSLVATTTPPQQTTPKGYRKRLIQSVASESQRVNQLLAEQAAAAAAAAVAAESGNYGGQDADTGVSPGRETISSSERAATKLVSPQAPPAGDLTKSHSSGDGEQANSSVVPAPAPKRRKKAKSRSGCVHVYF